ncbi:MAG: Ig-like domain-containing protein [Bacteroidota bacterium]
MTIFRKPLLFLFLFQLLITSTSAQGNTDYYQGIGRIAVSSDGNMHDNDDMLATMMTLMILAKGGLHDQTVLYTYADHVWGSESNDLERMKASINGSNDYWNFWNTKFMAAVEDPDAAYEAMRDEILKSTEEDPLFILAAGPMQVIGEGLNLAYSQNSSSLNHVTVISHSTWNERHADNPASGESHSGWTWSEMKSSFGSKVNLVEIDDQNGQEPNPYGDQNDFSASWSYWDWMRTHPDPSVQWVYTRGKSILGRGDYSDAGMAYYLIHNDEYGNYDKLRDWVGTDFIPVGTDDPSAVKGVSLSHSYFHLQSIGDEIQLAATVIPATADDQSVTWESGNSEIVTVSATGLVTGIKAGSTTITVRTNDRGFIAKTIIDVGTVEGSDFCVGEDFIAFEAEATNSDLGKWVVRTPDFSQYVEGNSGVPPTNNSYLEYTGGTENGNSPGQDILVYKFTPISDGTYRLTGRMAQNLQGAAWDKSNDVYVKMAGDFQPGTGAPSLSQLQSWNKVYGRGHDGGSPLRADWGAFVKGDIGHTKYSMKYVLKAGEEYTFSVSGRAQRTCVDYYLFVKEQEGVTIAERKDLATHTPQRMRPGCAAGTGCYVIKAHDFDEINIDGYDPATKGVIPNSPTDGINKGEPVIGCSGGNGLSRPIAAEETYTGISTDVTFIVKAVTEPDGECTYEVFVNGTKVGEKQTSRIFGTSTAPYTYEDLVINEAPVSITAGDVIRVTSNQVSNELVPEGTGFATARGRWASLEICGEGIVARTESLNIIDFSGYVLDTDLTVPVIVRYTANEARDIYVAVLDPSGNLIAEKTQSVEVGSGNSTVTIDLSETLSIAENYSVNVALKQKDGSSTILETSANFDVVDEIPSDEDLISYVSVPSQLTNTQTEIPATIAYSASEDRYINFALHYANGDFISNVRQDIGQGSGEMEMTIELDNPLPIGSGYKLDVAIRPPGGNWSSNIDQDGVVVDVVDASGMINVTGVSISPSSANLTSEGETMQLTPTISPGNATNQNVSWSSSDDAVATVSATGMVTAVANGNAEITATTEDGDHKATVDVNVNISSIVSVTGVSISSNSISLTSLGETHQLSATVTPSDATNQNLIWTSDDESIVSVDNTGMITAMDEGNTIVTVTTVDANKVASATITVSLEDETALGSPVDEENIWLYPNPAHNRVTIKSKVDSRILVLNAAGQVVVSDTAEKTVTDLDISSLETGLYFVTIENMTAFQTNRLVIR